MLDCRYGCNRKFKNLEAKKKHRDAYHGNSSAVIRTSMMKCRFGCERSFGTVEAMLKHRNDFHDIFVGSKVLGSHLREEKKKDFHHSGSDPGANKATKLKRTPVTACNDCGKEFSSVAALRQHQITKENHIRLARDVGSFGCEACNRTLRNQESLEQHFVADHSLIHLEKGDKVRAQLETKFLQNWRKPSSPGTVMGVFKVYNLGWHVLGFERYKKALENNGNEVDRYHGTSLLCELGFDKKSKLCQRVGCNLCSILRSGFKTGKARTGWQRFGPGIYTTATSGKSNDYIRSSSNRRAVLICRVAAGKVFRTQDNMPTLDRPPPGYDSVSGEVGIHLNYDETVVYSSKAILPSYIIVYTWS